ncbi:MAG: serine hydrolase [Bryobacteraceae bacterium]
MRILTFLALAAALSAAEQTTEQRVDAAFNAFNKPDSPGCALAVLKDGRIAYQHAYGQADLSYDIANSPSTIFHTASISKQFTAAAVILLALDGKLSLDDQVRKYIPELPDYGAPLTIRHLIYQTSGLRDQFNLLGLNGWRNGADLYTEADVLSIAFRQKHLNYVPGQHHSYSNTNYSLLGLIVKRVSGQSLREFTSARIFGPLGMKHSFFRDDHTEIVKNAAVGYAPKGKGFMLSGPQYDTVGPSGLLSSVLDFALWDENFYKPVVGGPAFVREMLQRGKLADGTQLEYAAGLQVTTYRGLPMVGHSGGDPGYRGDVIRFPEQHFSVVCFCNTVGVRPDVLTRKVADIYLSAAMKPAATVVSKDAPVIPEAKLRSLAGLYWNHEGDEVRRVSVRDGKLFITPSGSTQAVIPTGENTFLGSGANPIEFRFEPVSGSARPRLVDIRALSDPQIFMPAEEFKPTAEDLKQYAGRYHGEELDPVYTIAVKAGKLYFIRDKFPDAEMKPTVRDVISGNGRDLRFVRDPDGKVTGLILSQPRTWGIRLTKLSGSELK